MTSPIFSSHRGAPSRRVTVALWISRILALAVTSLYLFAWWDESQARQDPMLGGVSQGDVFYQWAVWTHFLPAVALSILTVFGWNKPKYAGSGFAIFAVLQILTVGTELVYIPIVVAPGLIVAIAFATAYRWGMRDAAGKEQS